MPADVILLNPSYVYPPFGPADLAAIKEDPLVMDLPSEEFLYPPVGLLSIGKALRADGFASGGTHDLVGVLTAMLDHAKPIVGRIQGHVAGGGNGLVAACDLAVASAEAKFAFSEVRVGVAPAIISVVCLQVMGRRAAQELMLTGQRVGADRVLEAGLVTSVAEPEALDAEVGAIVDALLQAGPEALANTKALLRRIPAMARDDAFAWSADMSASLFTSEEAREGMTAFLEKRKPEWAP